MAAAFRANAIGGDGLSSGSASDISVTVPSGAAVGDVALVVIENNSTTVTITAAPSGWTLESGPDSDTSAGSSWLYSKTLASGEPGSTVTWTLSGGGRPTAAMIVFSGVTTTGKTVATPAIDTSSVSTLTVPTIASVPAGAAVAALFGRNRTANNGTPPDVTVASPYSQGTSPRAATAFASGGLNTSAEVAYLIAGSAGSYGGQSLSIAGGSSRGTTYLVSLPVTGGGSITGTGALTAAAATLSGAGTVKVTGSGALTATAATLSGTGTLKVTGSGALAATAATLSGAGVVTGIGSTGALAAAPATLSGSGTVLIVGTGALTATAATLTATGLLTVTGTGALTAGAATLTGAGAVQDTFHPHLPVTAVLTPNAATAVLTGNGIGTAVLVGNGIGTATLEPNAGTATLNTT